MNNIEITIYKKNKIGYHQRISNVMVISILNGNLKIETEDNKNLNLPIDNNYITILSPDWQAKNKCYYLVIQ